MDAFPNFIWPFDPADLHHLLQVWVLGFARLSALLIALPLISNTIVTGLVRTGVIMGLSLVIYPKISVEISQLENELSMLETVVILLKEVIIGATIGAALGTIVWAIEAAGFFADNQRGSMMADSLSPNTTSQVSSTSLFLIQTYIAYFFAFGGFLSVLELIYSSYVLWPVTANMPIFTLETVKVATNILDEIIELIFVILGPAIIMMFLVEIVLGFYTRYAPQLNVFILSMPVKSALLYFLMILMSPFIFQFFEESLINYKVYFDSLMRSWQ